MGRIKDTESEEEREREREMKGERERGLLDVLYFPSSPAMQRKVSELQQSQIILLSQARELESK